MTLPELFSNFFQTSLSGACGSGDTTIQVSSPAPTALQASPGQFRVLVESELMLVTGGAATESWTVTRGVGNTVAVAHGDGVDVTHIITAEALGSQSDAGAGVPSLRTLGTGATQAAAGTAPGAVLASSAQRASNLSDLADAGSSRVNLHVPALTPTACVATSNLSLSGLQTIDGYTLVAGDLVLLTGQSTASQNGLWTAASGSWTRPTEMATGAVMKARTVAVIQGTAHAGETWLLQTNGSVTVDTTAQTWVAQTPVSVASGAALGTTSLQPGAPAALAGAGTASPALKITDPGGAGSTINQFILAPRLLSGGAFPVPFLRPVQANSKIALDLMPNGSPSADGSDVCHIDICDSDVPTGSGSTATARIGIYRPTDDSSTVGHVYFGSINLSAVLPDVWVSTNGVSSPQIKLQNSRSGSTPAIFVGLDGSNIVMAPTNGGVVGLAPADTSGYFFMPGMTDATRALAPPAGAPTGVPAATNYGESRPVVANRTDKRWYWYVGGVWRSLFPVVDAANTWTVAQTFTLASAEAVQIRSGAAGSWSALSLGRVNAEAYVGIAAGSGQFLNGSAAGDVIITPIAATAQVLIGSGTSVNPVIAVKGATLGLFGHTPAAQPTGTPAAATDLASVITLANALRTSLLALGAVA